MVVLNGGMRLNCIDRVFVNSCPQRWGCASCFFAASVNFEMVGITTPCNQTWFSTNKHFAWVTWVSSEIRHHTLVNAQMLVENSKLCQIFVKCIIQWLDLCNFVPLLQMPIYLLHESNVWFVEIVLNSSRLKPPRHLVPADSTNSGLLREEYGILTTKECHRTGKCVLRWHWKVGHFCRL